MNKDQTFLQFHVDDTHHGTRLDKYLAAMIQDHSRSTIQSWIKNAHVCIDDEICHKPKTTVCCEDTISVDIPKQKVLVNIPENISLHIVHEDDDILILDKPAGLVVHPGAGNPSGTLLNALLYHRPKLNHLPRAGIVHRLDKDTSGLMMVAKNQQSYLTLCEQLALRTIKRKYLAIVHGYIQTQGIVDEPIGRSSHNRQKMAITSHGKPAITHWKLQQRLQDYSLVECELHTGRTHQIRVHMKHILHPIIGDPTYGRNKTLKSTANNPLNALKRQALHAYELELSHPITQKPLTFNAHMPDDMQSVIQFLSI